MPIASGSALGDERVDVGQAAADVQVRARAEHDGRARLAREAPIVGAGVDHVDEQRRGLGLERAQRRQVGDGRLARHARRRVDAHAGQQRGPAAGAVAQQRELVFVLGDVNRGRAPRGGRGREDAARAARDRRSRGRAAPGRSRGAPASRRRPRRARARRRPARRRSRISRDPNSSWNSTPARPARPIPGAAASELPTSPTAAVPSATAAAAAAAAASRCRCRPCRRCERRISVVAQANRPCPPGTASACAGQLEVAVRVDQAGQQHALARAPRRASGNSARTSARPPTASTAPSSRERDARRRRSAGAQSGRTQRALTNFTADPPVVPTRRPAARSACCAGAA